MARYELKSEVTGSVWKILKAAGDGAEEGETLMILESMKMEIPVIAEDGGSIVEVRVAEGAAVKEGDVLLVIED